MPTLHARTSPHSFAALPTASFPISAPALRDHTTQGSYRTYEYAPNGKWPPQHHLLRQFPPPLPLSLSLSHSSNLHPQTHTAQRRTVVQLTQPRKLVCAISYRAPRMPPPRQSAALRGLLWHYLPSMASARLGLACHGLACWLLSPPSTSAPACAWRCVGGIQYSSFTSHELRLRLTGDDGHKIKTPQHRNTETPKHQNQRGK